MHTYICVYVHMYVCNVCNLCNVYVESALQHVTEFFGMAAGGQNVVLDEAHEDGDFMTAMLSSCLVGGMTRRLILIATPTSELYQLPEVQVVKAQEEERPPTRSPSFRRHRTT